MRVLVCRARSDGLRTARSLIRSGHEAVIAPVLAIEPLPIELPPLLPDAILATSAHAIDELADEHVAWLSPCPIYVVGEHTAEAARGRGFARVSAGSGDGAAMAALIARSTTPPARLLYLAGRVRKPVLERMLASHEYEVTVVETYVARDMEAWDEDVRRDLTQGRLQACLHYSARSADLAVEFARRAGAWTAFAGLDHLCLAPDIGRHLSAHGIRPVGGTEV